LHLRGASGSGGERTGVMRRWVPLVSMAAGLAVAVGVVMALFARPATGLVGATPTDGAVLERPPSSVRLTFGGDVDPNVAHVAVLNARGAGVAAGSPQVEDGSVELPIMIGQPGYYQVAYHVRLVDHGDLTGQLTFRVTSAAPAAAPEITSDSSTHVHNGSLDPLTMVVLGANAITLLIIGGKTIRRRTRAAGTIERARRTIPS
jgi:methionine-rich copper-binding protein CopC